MIILDLIVRFGKAKHLKSKKKQLSNQRTTEYRRCRRWVTSEHTKLQVLTYIVWPEVALFLLGLFLCSDQFFLFQRSMPISSGSVSGKTTRYQIPALKPFDSSCQRCMPCIASCNPEISIATTSSCTGASCLVPFQSEVLNSQKSAPVAV